MKKILISFLTTSITILSVINALPAKATSDGNYNITNFGTGGEWTNPELCSELVQNDYKYNESKTLPSSFDITTNTSTAPYFPPIGNQGLNMNSCAGWASTYYQFTYEVNKLKNEPTNSNNIYSPAWTYNYINGGCNNFTNIADAYSVLNNKGALKLVDFPCGNDPTTYSYSWSTDDDKMIEALNYRAKSSYSCVYGSSDISAIKAQLADGHVAVIWTNPNGWTADQNSNNQWMVVRGSYCSGGHFMCVVGYDDNIEITYNNVTFKGAFKLANSGGSSWGNSGYIWVCYDALNLYSQYQNWENSFTSTRTRVFGSYDQDSNVFSYNYFYFIEAKHCTPYFIGKIDYYSYDPWHLKLYGDQGTSASTIKWEVSNNYSQTNYTYYSHIFDYADINGQTNLNSCLSSNWTVKLTGDSTYTTTIFYTRILDNLGENIATNTVFNTLNYDVYSYTQYINLKKGRISSYDNGALTSSDISLLQSFILGNTELSNLQMYLADMNNDETVDIFDLVLLRQAVLSQNKSNIDYEEIMMTYIPEFNCTIEEYILSEYGENGLLVAQSLLSNSI